MTYTSNDRSFRLADGQPNYGYLCKDGLQINSRGTSRFIDNLRQAKLPTEDSKPAGNNEGQTVSSKRKRAPVPSRQRRHDNDNNDRGNTNNNTINDGRDDDDADEFSQPFWTKAKSKAGRATPQHARNNNNNNNNRHNKQLSRISDHGTHRSADEHIVWARTTTRGVSLPVSGQRLIEFFGKPIMSRTQNDVIAVWIL